MPATLLTAALQLSALGLSVIPLKPRSKQPDGSWAQYATARASEAELSEWFGNGVARNIGIVLGPISGVVVVESDSLEAEAWCAAHLPATPMMTRSARGFHRYFRPPVDFDGLVLPATINAGDGLTIELKREGQYVVAPGSVHPTGHSYAEVAPWPETLDVLPEFPVAVVADQIFGTSTITSRAPSSPMPTAVAVGNRNNLLFREGARLARLGWRQTEITDALRVLNRERCEPPLEDAEVETIGASCARYEPAVDTFPLTDTGNAEFLASVDGSRLKFDHARRAWFIFNGHHMVRDRTGLIDRIALDAIRARHAAAVKLTDSAARKAHANHAVRSENRIHRDNMVKVAATLAGQAVTGDDWDSKPLLLGVQNGVLDLELGRLRDGSPDDLITKVTPTAYDASARCLRWERFLREIFADTPEMPDYFRRVLGYALTGLTTEQVFWILWGLGANGKSTLIETILVHVLGEAYGWTMPFPAAGWTNAMSEYQKASLVGQRLVAASEVTRQGCLNEELIKSLTGGDTINARHPYGRPFQYVPVAKIFLRVNDKPVIRDQSHGMWRRVKLVPFTQTFSVDMTLASTLASEADGILAWAVQGCIEWQRDGLRHPDVVTAATEQYRGESDHLTEFFAERCVLNGSVRVGGKALFQAYGQWCDGRQLPNTERLNQTAFGLRIKERFAVTSGRTVTYEGIGLLEIRRSSDDM